MAESIQNRPEVFTNDFGSISGTMTEFMTQVLTKFEDLGVGVHTAVVTKQGLSAFAIFGVCIFKGRTTILLIPQIQNGEHEIYVMTRDYATDYCYETTLTPFS